MVRKSNNWIRNVVLFEDEATLNLEPLSLTRPVWELRCGIWTLRQKIEAQFSGAQFHFNSRPYLSMMGNKKLPRRELDVNRTLWINGSFLPGTGFAAIQELEPDHAWVRDGRALAFRGRPLPDWQAGTQLPLSGFHITEAPPETGILLSYSWDYIYQVKDQIQIEARHLKFSGKIQGEIHPQAVLLNEKGIHIAGGCRIAPGAVLDAESGPIVLDDNVQIGANAVIEGPVYLGPNTRVKPLSHIKESSIGEECRVGGEVTNSIIQGYSNKQHGGFLGHSFLGSWCNLGSGTETSNLKNNYAPVRVQVGKDLVDTGQLFVGLVMGDHSKTAIGTVFNTGTVVGVACNVFGSGFPPRLIPSFHWGGADKLTPYPFKKTLETAQTVMARRGKTLDSPTEDVLKWIHKNRIG